MAGGHARRALIASLPVHVRIALRCDARDCREEHVVFAGRVFPGCRLPEPELPPGWVALTGAANGEYPYHSVYCAIHAERITVPQGGAPW